MDVSFRFGGGKLTFNSNDFVCSVGDLLFLELFVNAYSVYAEILVMNKYLVNSMSLQYSEKHYAKLKVLHNLLGF